MNPNEIIERLLSENPKLHHVSESHVKLLSNYGMHFEPGPVSWAVPPELIRYFAKAVKPSDKTVETGGGHSTIAIAALSSHHTCITVDEKSVELTSRYMEEVGIPKDRVTFIVESSDTALPKLEGEFDFAFVDGNHSYPFPAVDWHYLDLRLKIGGIMGFDNTEMRAVYDHCQFMEENGTYDLVERIGDTCYGENYGADFFVKKSDDEREAFNQAYSLKRAKKLTMVQRFKRMVGLEKPIWPWD